MLIIQLVILSYITYITYITSHKSNGFEYIVFNITSKPLGELHLPPLKSTPPITYSYPNAHMNIIVIHSSCNAIRTYQLLRPSILSNKILFYIASILSPQEDI